MKKENISEVINNIDDKYIEEATMFASEENQDSTDQHSLSDKQSSTHKRKVRWGVLAACLALFIVIGSTITAFAVEAREYNTALSFFNENGLSTEGLSRSDIKAVYRDITTYSFTFEKTAQVLKRAVPGWEIEHDEPTPEELSAIWNKNVWVKPISKNGIDYHIEGHYSDDTELGFSRLDKCILECYLDGARLWSAEFSDFYVHGYSFIKDFTIVWGYNIRYSTYEKQQGYIALVDNNGNTLWQQCLNHDFKDEYITSVLRNTDGTWAVISRGDYKYLCLSCYDYNGKELSFHKTEIGNYGIWNAALLENGYIIQLGNQSSKDTALLFKMDKEGNLTEMISYKADDCDYYITDMVEFEGHIYLSAYAVPNRKEESGRREIANILDYTFDKLNEGIMDIPSEELTPIVRDNYTAIILKCDTENGAPKTFYSVKGSLGGKLVVNKQGDLEWNVERIVSTYFSPSTSSFTIGGTSSVVKYTFNKSGVFIGQTDTGDTVPFRR